MASESRDKDKSQRDSKMVVDFDLVRRIAGRNLRDLGGHPVRNRRRIKRKHIYRSAHLATIPAESPALGLQLKTIITLQSQAEVSALGGPHRSLVETARWEHIPIGDKWFRNGGTPVAVKRGHEHLVLVTDFPQAWRNFFGLLAEQSVYPALFHCSAGRDRTGVGAALLLEVLGVDRETIVADFLESNTAFPAIPLDRAQLDPLFELIDAAGDIDRFLEREIGVEAQALEVIRRGLLED